MPFLVLSPLGAILGASATNARVPTSPIKLWRKLAHFRLENPRVAGRIPALSTINSQSKLSSYAQPNFSAYSALLTRGVILGAALVADNGCMAKEPLIPAYVFFCKTLPG